MLGFSHTQLSLPTFATCCDFGERHILSLNGLEIRQCTELRKSWSAPLGGIFASCAEVSEHDANIPPSGADQLFRSSVHCRISSPFRESMWRSPKSQHVANVGSDNWVCEKPNIRRKAC